MKNIPIIFIHYGQTEYLEYTLKIAKHYNQNKEIILLGDEMNVYVKKWGVKHFLMNQYMDSDEITRFHQVFKIIARDGYSIGKPNLPGAKNDGGLFWTKFVFLKMFVFLNFCKAEGIEKFWTFDSDNMIVNDLSQLESYFGGYDNTELNNGNSMHGIINNLSALEKYCITINDLFEDEEFLKSVSAGLREAPLHHAYTEMWAYYEFKKRNNFKSYYLTNIFENSMFDNKIVWPDNVEVAEYNNLILKKIKRIWFKSDDVGNIIFYFKELKSGEYIKVYSFDCSWVPVFVFGKIYTHVMDGIKTQNGLVEIEFDEPLKHRVNRFRDDLKIKFIKKVKKIWTNCLK